MTIQLVSESLGDSESCIRSILTGLGEQAGTSSTYLFFPPRVDREAVERVLQEVPYGSRIIGCTTAGEISLAGYCDGVVSGISLPDKDFTSLSYEILDLENIATEALGSFARNVQSVIVSAQQKSPRAKAFAVLLIDGLSVAEELVVGHLSALLPQVPIVGGSAGDGLDFRQTFVLSNGKFRRGSAIFTVVVTEQPFHCFKTQHFSPSQEKMVITVADPSKRLVYEINGENAAKEYARLLSIPPESLGPEVFANHPVCSRHGGDYYVRSIQRVNSDGSLLFYSAIDEGLVLTLSKGSDIIRQTQESLHIAAGKLGRIKAMLAFECILRRIEVSQKDLVNEMNELFVPLHTVGFHTYGEQFGSLHVNQTLAAVCFGSEH